MTWEAASQLPVEPFACAYHFYMRQFLQCKRYLDVFDTALKTLNSRNKSGNSKEWENVYQTKCIVKKRVFKMRRR